MADSEYNDNTHVAVVGKMSDETRCAKLESVACLDRLCYVSGPPVGGNATCHVDNGSEDVEEPIAMVNGCADTECGLNSIGLA